MTNRRFKFIMGQRRQSITKMSVKSVLKNSIGDLVFDLTLIGQQHGMVSGRKQQKKEFKITSTGVTENKTQAMTLTQAMTFATLTKTPSNRDAGVRKWWTPCCRRQGAGADRICGTALLHAT
jgi:hypothetical protein